MDAVNPDKSANIVLHCEIQNRRTKIVSLSDNAGERLLTDQKTIIDGNSTRADAVASRRRTNVAGVRSSKMLKIVVRHERCASAIARGLSRHHAGSDHLMSDHQLPA